MLGGYFVWRIWKHLVSTRKNQIEIGVLEPIPKLELECIYLKNWTQNQILGSIYVWNQNWNPEFWKNKIVWNKKTRIETNQRLIW